jgi:hypothetical protein
VQDRENRCRTMGCVENSFSASPGLVRFSASSFSKMLMAPLGS